MGTWSKVKSGVREAKKSFGDGQFEVNGTKINCPVCQNSKFSRSTAQLNTAGATFLGFNWANKTVNTIICNQCSHVSWFAERPTRVVEPNDV